jgi:2,3-bisphosphoglycerate-dependent phosphoglycerate mutase
MPDEIYKAGVLVLVRHGESLWNATHRWTGLTDIGLSPRGKKEADKIANLLTGFAFDAAFTSPLTRAKDTLGIVLKDLQLTHIPIMIDPALNERNYGIFTGKNKLDIKREVGEEHFFAIRRGWDIPIPEGETLKDVYVRVVGYYKKIIAPLIKTGKNILVVAHGNSLRALMKYIEHISDSDIAYVELDTGEAVVYRINGNGTLESTTHLQILSKSKHT